MNAEIVSLSLVGVALVPVALALTQVVKAFVTDTRYIPIVAIVFGVALSFVVPASSIALTALQGVLIGLSAVGIFSGYKSVVSV